MLTYDATPSGKQTMAKWTMPAGIAAAIASVECHKRNIRSTKFIIVHDAVETISGIASRKHLASAARSGPPARSAGFRRSPSRIASVHYRASQHVS